MPRPLRVLTVATTILLVVARLAEAGPSVPPKPDGALRVVVWNIQRGANHFDQGAEKALDWIRATDADVCLLQESYDIDGERPTLGRWLAAELGWNAYQGTSPHLCILTPMTVRSSFHHADWHGVGALLEDGAGRQLVAYSIWIDYRAYTPHHLRDDPAAADEDLLLNETERSGRAAQAGAILDHLRTAGHLEARVPVLVGGDWNSPSHLDWTDETARVYRSRRALRFPASAAMEDAGFGDAFRLVHPEPLQYPGFTWSPLDRGTDEMPETADRIDRLYVRQPGSGPRLQAVAATVLPQVWEDASVPMAARAFPSDHGAVVVDLAWTAPAPEER